MTQRKPKQIAKIATLLVITAMCSSSYAGFSGHNTKGDLGLQSGSQPPPGWYMLAPMYYHYDGDRVKDRDGKEISPDPMDRGDLDANLYVLGLIWVAEDTFLGGNYSFQVFPGFTDNTLEAPVFYLNESVSTGLTDLYVQPVNIGWHTEQADFTAGLGIYAPTGEYESGGSNNRGLGMWSFEVFAGSTLFFDDAKSWHLSATAFYEIHTDKEDSDIRVGDILTVEGGLGKSFMDGALSLGVAYYAQWKLTDDDLGIESQSFSGRSIGKNRVYGIGPELTVPIASSEKLYGFLTARYFREFEAESTVEGESFVLSLTLPLPSVPLQ